MARFIIVSIFRVGIRLLKSDVASGESIFIPAFFFNLVFPLFFSLWLSFFISLNSLWQRQPDVVEVET